MSEDKQTSNAQDRGLDVLEESLGFNKQAFTNADILYSEHPGETPQFSLASYDVSTGGKHIPSVTLLATYPFFKIKNYKYKKKFINCFRRFTYKLLF